MLWRDGQPEPVRPPQQAQSMEHFPDQNGAGQRTPDHASTNRPMSNRIGSPTRQRMRSGTATMMRQASRSSGESFMERRMLHRRVHFHRQMGTSPKLRAVAFALGCSESVAETRLYGDRAANVQAAAIIGVLLARGEVEDAATFEAPISAAMLGPVVEPMLDLQRSADESDGYEDCAQAGWIAEKSDEALALYVRKLASDLYHGSRLLAALKAEQVKRVKP